MVNIYKDYIKLQNKGIRKSEFVENTQFLYQSS